MSNVPTPAEPPRRRKFSPTLIFLLVVVVAVGAIWWITHHGENADEAGRRRHMDFNQPLPVVAQAATKGDLNVYLEGLGTVTPLATVTVRTQISGVLERVAFQEGQEVKRGDLLAVIDPRPYQVALEESKGQLAQAQAQLSEARADLARYLKLAQQNSIAEQQVDSQQALVRQDEGLVQTDQAAIDSAKLNLVYCHITAPVSGRVGLRQVDPGNYVTPGDANGLVVLTEIKPISVIFSLPEDDIPEVQQRLQAGGAIPVVAYDRTDTIKLASGALKTIDNEVDTATGTFKLRADFPNLQESLFPNQFVNVQMLLKVEQGVTIIPTSGIEQGQSGSYVYVVNADGTVSARDVKLGATEGERVAVASGLAVGDRVVVDGADRLREGMRVILEAPAGAAPAAVAAPPRHGGKSRRHPDAGQPS
jgi:membrane fusion protein, multidrug efflux system